MPLKIIIIVFIIAIVGRTWARRRHGDLTGREAGAWTLVWLLVLAASLNPRFTDHLARWVGIGRGADLLIFIAIVGLLTIVFWLLVRVEKLEHDITTIVRHQALTGETKGPVTKE